MRALNKVSRFEIALVPGLGKYSKNSWDFDRTDLVTRLREPVNSMQEPVRGRTAQGNGLGFFSESDAAGEGIGK
jgi:hypothetical protein